MEKEFIGYEQALELKELGFNEPCASCYGSYTHKTNDLFLNINNPVNIETLVREKKAFNSPSFYIKAPTFSQAFRWFREKHRLISSVDISEDGTEQEHYFVTISTQGSYGSFKTYEEAELECLKKLIEIVKEKNQ